MFYKIIQRQRDLWLSSTNCAVRDLLGHMVRAGQMRDVQIDAIKTYLFLKTACGNLPLHELFAGGRFNTLNLDEVELTSKTREFLQNNPAAAALYEYAALETDAGVPFAPQIVQKIKCAPAEIDYAGFFRNAFYNVSYTDYLFSLPMGAGKTFLMAAFIYLDLYFAENEPDNPAFSHNFIIFAPSGLKSSVIPSLRTIQHFDPSWIIPEPAASTLRSKLVFEVLDQNKNANKSSRAKNPNVRKIAIHQPFGHLFGLVAVTNAEKVILDRVDIDEKSNLPQLIERDGDAGDRQANELRNLIGKLPHLSVFIDEVHHAATDDRKLRAVVSKWMRERNLNSVIGFSGTPYLTRAERVPVAGSLSVASVEIANIVHCYPLARGIGNFLKTPTVRIGVGLDRLQIVEKGLREFLSGYKDTVYPDGSCAKLGIYCGTIEALEEQIYPLAERIAAESGLNPDTCILRFHKGNSRYPVPVDSELQFMSLDRPFSRIRVILLVQVGKEGWDCRSLTGIVLSQKGDCPGNMVLQTSCRCLRQVQKGAQESALIYLNKSNAAILNRQLELLHHISIQEFQQGAVPPAAEIRYDTIPERPRQPETDFRQYASLPAGGERCTEAALAEVLGRNAEINSRIETAEAGMRLHVTGVDTSFEERGNIAAGYNRWLYEIARESFNFITLPMLKKHDRALRPIFDRITCVRDGVRCFSSRYNIATVNSNIRKALYGSRRPVAAGKPLPGNSRIGAPEEATGNIFGGNR